MNTELMEITNQFGIKIQPLQGELACVFVGEWSSGKSSLLNSLFAMSLLPEKPIPTNKTIVYLGRGSSEETVASIPTGENGEVERFQGQEAVESLQRAVQNLPRIDYRSDTLDMPENTLFIDTPGFNDSDQIAGSKAETTSADIVVFVINAAVSAINQTQIDFMNQVVIAKADKSDIFFVATNCDCLESKQDQKKLRQRIASYVSDDRVFLTSNKTQEGIAEFKQIFYRYITERQADVLDKRKARYYKHLTEALKHKITIERGALAHYKIQNEGQRKKLWIDIQEARKKEASKKRELRQRNRQLLKDTLYNLRDIMSSNEELLEKFIEISTVEQLQKKGHIQKKIDELMTVDIQPQIQNKLEMLLNSIQGEIQEGHQYSNQLLSELDVDISVYNSPLASVTGEQILPIAVIGSIVTFGWFSVPTLLVGFFAMKARDFGLTRHSGHSGLLDHAIGGVKETLASGYKKTMKIVIAKTVTDYTNLISDHFRDVVEQVSEKALQQINLVADLEVAMQALQNDSDVIEREIRLDKAEIFLKTL